LAATGRLFSFGGLRWNAAVAIIPPIENIFKTSFVIGAESSAISAHALDRGASNYLPSR
jgi:hypothetical protein